MADLILHSIVSIFPTPTQKEKRREETYSLLHEEIITQYKYNPEQKHL